MKELLEAGLKSALSERLKLIKGTPMRSGQVQQDFGILGNTSAVSKMVEGTYVAPEGSSNSVFGMLHMIGLVSVGVKDTIVDIVITLQ